jgi:CheY-like chemotaxis protein
MRILVVDDDPLLIQSMRDLLEADGHIVTTANGGKEGIAAFEASLSTRERFAVVLTDLGMPDVDGRKVATAIKGLSPATPVIMLTGWGQRMSEEDDLPAGVDRVMSKPPKMRDLRQALCEIPGQSSAPALAALALGIEAGKTTVRA